MSCILASTLLCGQSKTPFYGANTIILKASSVNDDSLYTVVGKALVAHGHSIEVNIPEFKQLKTGVKEIPDRIDIDYQVAITISEGSVIVTPYLWTNSIQGNYHGNYKWSWRKGKLTNAHFVEADILDCLGHIGETYWAKK